MMTAARLSITAVSLAIAIPVVAVSGMSDAPAGASVLAADSAYIVDIEQATLANDDYRRVLFTGPYMQLVLMTLQSGEDIGAEVHEDEDQFIRVEGGTGVAVLDGATHPVEDGTAIVIPAGVDHNIVNTGSVPLRMYVLYTPPEHPDGEVHRTKAEADAADHRHH